MRDKMLAVADRLEARANAWAEPWENDMKAFTNYPAWAVYTALNEMAKAIRDELEST